jgi:hypothetical protein
MFGCTNSPVAALFERFAMTRSSSPRDAQKRSPSLSHSTMPPSTPTKPKPSSPIRAKLGRSSSNRMRAQALQRKQYLHHLTQWSLNHDSSVHFHGKISLSTQNSRRVEDLELGRPVKCVLTDTSYTDARQKITIKLFPPQDRAEGTRLSDSQDERRDSMEPDDAKARDDHSQCDGKSGQKKDRQDLSQSPRGHYRMVVRCGAGWIPAREYFSKVYFSHLESQWCNISGKPTQDNYLARKSQALGAAPSDNDSVIIRPLFHAFRRLAPELQELVLMTAAGLSHSFNLCADDYGTLRMKRDQHRPAISLSTLLRISRDIHQHMLPYIYHSTDFHFGLTGYSTQSPAFHPC